MNLTCVGCGNLITRVPETKLVVLTISCVHCGAYSPILNEEGTDHIFSVPSSLGRMIYQRPSNKPHLEYYLGFSEHVSLLKISLIQELKTFGLISMADCEQDKCQARYFRELERVRGKSKVE